MNMIRMCSNCLFFVVVAIELSVKYVHERKLRAN